MTATMPRRPTVADPIRRLVYSTIWLVPLSVLRGLVIAKLWEWFVADTFGVQTLSGVEAIGLSTLITYVGWTWTDVAYGDKRVAEAVSGSLAAAGISMLCGLVVVQFL